MSQLTSQQESDDEHLLPPPEDAVHTGELPEWLDKGFPWIASILIHLGLFLLIVFTFMALKTVITKKAHPIIIPQTFNQPFSKHAGGNPNSGQNHNLQKAHQNIKHMLSHYTNNTTSAVAALNSASNKAVNFVAVGPQGGGGAMASYGLPGGGGVGSGPPSRFLGSGGNATRIVYIIDHSGDMTYNFQFVGRELRKSINELVPIQRFGIVLVSQRANWLGGSGLAHATMLIKKLFWNRFSTVAPTGTVVGRLQPYVNAFNLALEAHPQIIYFVSNGGFNPALANRIQQMDPHGATKVFTYTFLNGNSQQFLDMLQLYAPALKKIARETGGQYRLIKQQ